MKIAVFGMGRSGISVYKYLKQKTDVEVFLVSAGDPQQWGCKEEIKDDLVNAFDEKAGAKILGEMDEVILSPGIPRTHDSLKIAVEKNIPIISEIEFTYRHSDIPVVAITGTNGKTTTTTMIGESLAMFNKNVFICGNIGRPYADILREKEKIDYAVIELSSFQLESIDTFHPQIALLLNITENHMERYSKFSDYENAKLNIFKNQVDSDYAVVYKKIETKAQQILISPLEGFNFSKSTMVGVHNKLNFDCTYKVLKILLGRDIDETFQEFIDTFSAVDFRLQFKGSKDNLNFYNDAKSTNSDATKTAVDSFAKKEELSLILGGQLRSDTIDHDQKINLKHLKNIFLIGESCSLLEKKIKLPQVKVFETLYDVLLFIKEEDLTGDVLFSPGFPSFDQYKNYIERGEDFNQRLEKLFGL